MYNLIKQTVMKAYLYSIQALTNLHVGSGEANAGVVDNLIQRDPATGLPAINASSLKGAIREHCTTEKMDGNTIKGIFGGEPKKDERLQGQFRFFDGRLLAIPVRSDKVPFLMATCPSVLKDFKETLGMFGMECPIDLSNLPDVTAPVVCNQNWQGAYIEDLSQKTTLKIFNLKGMEPFTGNHPLVLLSDEDFSTVCNEQHLPVIARNYLENGISKNLWYEQVLPRHTALYFILLAPENGELKKAFDKEMQKVVQIGANATVGYGFCKVQPI